MKRWICGLLALLIICAGGVPAFAREKADKTAWVPLGYTVHHTPTAAPGSSVAALYDGDPKTFFLCGEKAGTVAPRHGNALVFDLGGLMENVGRLRLLPRQDDALEGRPQAYRIYAAYPNATYSGRRFTGEAAELEGFFRLVGQGEWDPAETDWQTATFLPVNTRFLVLLLPFNPVGGENCGAAEIEIDQGLRATGDYNRQQTTASALLQFGKEQNLPAVQQAAQNYLDYIGNDSIAFARLTLEEQTRLQKQMEQETALYKTVGKQTKLLNGGLWIDGKGARLAVGSGSIFYDEAGKRYYWYGADTAAPTLPGKAVAPGVGVHCYVSKDLLNWEDVGNVLPVFNNPQFADGTKPQNSLPMYVGPGSAAYKKSALPAYPQTDSTALPLSGTYKAPENTFAYGGTNAAQLNALYDGLGYEARKDFYQYYNWETIIHHPQVIYNAATKQYVLWMQLGSLAADKTGAGVAAVATGSSPTGPFRLNAVGTLPGTLADGSALQHRVRDFALFANAKGNGYLVYASAVDGAGFALQLNKEGTAGDSANVVRFTENLQGSPVLLRSGKTFYLLAGGTTYTTGSFFGQWKEKTGAYKDKAWNAAFFSQADGAIPLRNTDGTLAEGQYYLLSLRANPYDQQADTHLLLPMTVQSLWRTLAVRWGDSALPRVPADSSLLWIIIFCALGVLLLGAAGVLLVVVLRKHKKKAAPRQKSHEDT
ncbi:MAG: hypothetical protein LBB50_01475 [Oscillospiraceae bacterium]|jgi:hypothetical protein|nr:hypothetical protein [Oscillospiraceae bacterium]